MAAEKIIEHFSRWLTTCFTVARISATTFLTPLTSFTQRSSMPGNPSSSSAAPILLRPEEVPFWGRWLCMHFPFHQASGHAMHLD